MSEKIGFIGLGAMGYHMVKNLLKNGHSVRVVNRSRQEIVEELVAAGAETASRQEIAEQCSMIFICVPTGQVSIEILFGEDGIADRMKPGTLFVEFGSLTVDESMYCCDGLAKRGVRYIDCPVSGAPTLASIGKLAMMAGGDAEDFERAKPILACMGTPVLTGGHGSGCITKFISQSICAAEHVIFGEMFYLGAMAGLDLPKVFEAIRGGASGSMLLDRNIPMMLEKKYDAGAFLGTVYKDLKQVEAFAHELDCPIPVLSCLTEIYKVESHKGRDRDDVSAMIRYYEELVGKAFDEYEKR